MTAPRRPRPTTESLVAANASLRAEVAAAQQRTRDIEKARQKLEADLGAVRQLADNRRAAATSAIVSLARNLGVDAGVLQILANLHGWHDPDDCQREDEYA